MGGIFSSPSMPAIAAPAPIEDTTAEEEKKARLEGIERRRRGRAGTIHTSERGLLQSAADKPKKKDLLGE
ncbi:MAG: hypothetical protein HQL36_01325 [Alphaproteobacteria bacterium]|nr:hypothetical protein [Alphaproteobacteria bacterium]MBF0249876.1 hypothetical protein [Alphaproteobacteria bacterium]